VSTPEINFRSHDDATFDDARELAIHSLAILLCRTTKLYGRRGQKVLLEEGEHSVIERMKRKDVGSGLALWDHLDAFSEQSRWFRAHHTPSIQERTAELSGRFEALQKALQVDPVLMSSLTCSGSLPTLSPGSAPS